MALAVTHVIPGIDPSPYHPKCKDISEDGMIMLILVEEAYNKMLGTRNKPIKATPVLPNLVTSTDKVTIFATPTLVNGKESFYLVSKPTSIKYS